MHMPWESEHKCAHEDNDFEDCNLQSIPNTVHELCREHRDLKMIDLSSIGMNNVFAHENFATEESHDVDSGDKEAFGEDASLVENGLSSAR